jgi:hypothetical protein
VSHPKIKGCNDIQIDIKKYGPVITGIVDTESFQDYFVNGKAEKGVNSFLPAEMPNLQEYINRKVFVKV